MLKLAILASFILAVFAGNGLNLPESFNSNVKIDFKFDHHSRDMAGKIWTDSTQKADRFDVQLNNNNKTQFEGLDLFSTKMAYDIFDGKDCKSHALDRTFYPFFDWVADAEKKGGCRGPSKALGSEYELKDNQRNIDARVCVADDGKTPYWVDFNADRDHRRANRFIEFLNFHPGSQQSSVFSVPSVCN